jgi:phospholipid transport system substrate-binding protein
MKRSHRLSVLIASAVALALPAFADAKTEAYVQKNASEVLSSLNNPKLSQAERTAAFSSYMDKFADLDRVSSFVIGKYARAFTAEEKAKYKKSFRAYALAVYESELDALRGEAVVVKGSTDKPAYSVVKTVIKRKDGKETDVRWRVRIKDGAYSVEDVALNIEGNLIWLAISQKDQFIAVLDKSNGSADALIKKIDSMTASLRAKARK